MQRSPRERTRESRDVPPSEATVGPADRSASNRGFWLIAAAFVATGAVVVAGAVMARPEPASARATINLALAARAARIVSEASIGGYAAAGPEELGVVELRLAFVAEDHPSTGPKVISVRAGERAWVAAALDEDGVCRWIRLVEGRSAPSSSGGRSGSGACTADGAASRDTSA